MSFDLYFYKRKDNPLTENEIANYLTKHIGSTDAEYSRQWVYENNATNVYFTVEWNKADIDDDETNAGLEEFANTNFSFSINYFCPDYVALESFPIIYRFVYELKLFVYDPQDRNGKDIPYNFNEEELIASYIQSNNQVTQGQHKAFNLQYMPAEKSNYFWQWQYHKAVLENTIKEDIYIPNLILIRQNTTGELLTACAWTTHIPLVLPKVDILIIQKKYKKLFSNVEETGVVLYDTVMEELGSYFEELTYNVPDLKILTQQKADQLAAKFNRLKLFQAIQEFGTGVSMGAFVNTKPI